MAPALTGAGMIADPDLAERLDVIPRASDDEDRDLRRRQHRGSTIPLTR
jgi:hypothetical protein